LVTKQNQLKAGGGIDLFKNGVYVEQKRDGLTSKISY